MIRIWTLVGLMAISAGIVVHDIEEGAAETRKLREELRNRRDTGERDEMEFRLRRCEYEAYKALKRCGCAEVTP